ncbi:MAG: glycosyltransferase [Nitrospirota bacterium]|nr:glycosyltransferase [Nitrospirota bacterium]
MTEPAGISVVIPNYNGTTLLKDNIPSIINALNRWGGPHEIIIVDDCSVDESCKVIMREFPAVKLIVNQANAGFSRTCNRGFAEARYPIILCINNDVKAEPDFVAPLLTHFSDSGVFAVTPNILAERDGKNQGIVSGGFGKGFIRGGFAPLDARGGVRENLYAVGACVAYDAAKLRDLGGYAEIYCPYLFEDVDLSYRGWKRGWKSLYEPASTVHHFSSATIGRTKKRVKRTIYFRNRFLFHWINLTDPSFRAANYIHTALRLLVSFLWLDLPYYASFFGALRRLGEVRKLRKTVLATLATGDAEIVARTGTPLRDR